jgi:hypothetical protein
MSSINLGGKDESILVRIPPKLRKFMQVRWYEQKVPIFRISGMAYSLSLKAEQARTINNYIGYF